MPFKRYDSQVWWVSFTCSDGSRIRRSTGTTSKKEAEALELKWKLEVFQEKQWEKQPDRLFEELLVAYLHAHQDKKSAGRDISAAKHLRRVFEGKILASFCAQDVRAYIECRQELVKAATINRELCLLSTALNFGKRELEWDIPNPVLGRKLKQPEGRVRWINKAEASSLLRSAEPWPYLVDFIMLALHTGCRKQELLGLEWKRVDLQRNLLDEAATRRNTLRPTSI
jgi:integrase